MKKPRTLWEKKKDKPLIKAAMTLTKCDVQRFNQYTILLNQSQIPDAEKESMILFIREMCNALKILKDSFDEQKFCISYSHFFNGDKCHDLARDNYLKKYSGERISNLHCQKYCIKFTFITLKQCMMDGAYEI